MEAIIERPTLDVTHTNFGYFYKAKLNGEAITKDQLFKLLGIEEYTGFRLEYHVTQFEKNNPNYNVEIWEMDVT